MTSLDTKPQHRGQMVAPGWRKPRLHVAAVHKYGAPLSQHGWQEPKYAPLARKLLRIVKHCIHWDCCA